jgi:hypothetical protein
MVWALVIYGVVAVILFAVYIYLLAEEYREKGEYEMEIEFFFMMIIWPVVALYFIFAGVWYLLTSLPAGLAYVLDWWARGLAERQAEVDAAKQAADRMEQGIEEKWR